MYVVMEQVRRQKKHNFKKYYFLYGITCAIKKDQTGQFPHHCFKGFIFSLNDASTMATWGSDLSAWKESQSETPWADWVTRSEVMCQVLYQIKRFGCYAWAWYTFIILGNMVGILVFVYLFPSVTFLCAAPSFINDVDDDSDWREKPFLRNKNCLMFLTLFLMIERIIWEFDRQEEPCFCFRCQTVENYRKKSPQKLSNQVFLDGVFRWWDKSFAF